MQRTETARLNTLNEFGRTSLPDYQIRHHREALKEKAFYDEEQAFWGIASEGMFSRVLGGSLTPDGYLSLPCEICRINSVIAYIEETESGLSPVSLTEDAHVGIDQMVICAHCNAVIDEEVAA